MRLANHLLARLGRLAYAASQKSSLRRILFNSIRLKRIETERFRHDEAYRFLAYTLLNRHRSRSQIMQDLWVCYQLGELHDGFFVEFGATNGVTNSNTWMFEKHYNWRGILAEPNPVWHAELSNNRAVSIDHRCVASSTGEVVRFLTTDTSDPELSSIAEFSGGDHFAGVRAEGTEISVETVSLNDLLRQHKAPYQIDYMSIDTEGNEYEILSRFDFSSHAINLMSVELNRNTEIKIEALLIEKGYVRVFREFSQWDGWFMKPEYLQKHHDCDEDQTAGMCDAAPQAGLSKGKDVGGAAILSRIWRGVGGAPTHERLHRGCARSGGRKPSQGRIFAETTFTASRTTS